jgi:hypothetical protein
MDLGRERRARNEALFREVNERIEEVDERLGHVAPEPSQLIVLCECGTESCTGRLELTRAQYEAVRSDAKRFFVLPEHVDPRIERVVEEHAGFAVVEKFEHEAAVANKHDPRS